MVKDMSIGYYLERRGQIVLFLQIVSLLLLIAMLLFRASAVQNIVMSVAGFFFLVEYVVNCRWTELVWTRDKWLYVAMIVYYLFIPLWNIGTDVHSQHLSFVMGERVPFVICGLVGLVGLNRNFKLEYVCYVMLASAVLTSLYIIYRSGGWSFFVSSLSEQSEMFMSARIKWVNSHMKFNIYLNVSLVFAFYLIVCGGIRPVLKGLIAVLCLWLFYILSLSEGRVGFATGVVLAMSMVLILVYRLGGLKYAVPVVVVCAAIGVFMIMQHDRLKADNLQREPRWELWRESRNMITEKPLVGYGVCDARDLLIRKITNNDVLSQYYLPRVKHLYNNNLYKIQPHNAFLEAWSEFGILGILLLLFIFVFPLGMKPRRNRIFIMLIVGVFVLQSMFDSFFSPLLYCLSIIFFTSQSEISLVECEQMSVEG